MKRRYTFSADEADELRIASLIGKPVNASGVQDLLNRLIEDAYKKSNGKPYK